MSSYTSPKNSRRGCLCADGKRYSKDCCKGKLINQGIGTLKKQENVAVLQSKRWNEILGKMVLEGEQHNLSEEFILKLFKAVHQESINHQELILNK